MQRGLTSPRLSQRSPRLRGEVLTSSAVLISHKGAYFLTLPKQTSGEEKKKSHLVFEECGNKMRTAGGAKASTLLRELRGFVFSFLLSAWRRLSL